MAGASERYNRRAAEKRFGRVYETVEDTRCVYCGMPSDGQHDHQPPLYVLHRFAVGRLVTKRAIRERFGQCKLVPCCMICNMGLGAYDGRDDNDRRREIIAWFLVDERYPGDELILAIGYRLIGDRMEGKRSRHIYAFSGVGRAIYIEALMGLMDGEFSCPDEFPKWLQLAQSELAEWLRGTAKRKYFLDMAKLASYDLLPHARGDSRGKFAAQQT